MAPRPALQPDAGPALARADLAVAELVGTLMELWGLRRQLGRVWGVLFMSERPLTAAELCERLGISTGLLSMSLAELRELGAVRRVEVPESRKDHYEAEVHVSRLVAHVLERRELPAVEAALAAVEQAIAEARAGLDAADPASRAAARFRLRRLEALADLCRAALRVLGLLLAAARAESGPLRAIGKLLGRGRRRRRGA